MRATATPHSLPIGQPRYQRPPKEWWCEAYDPYLTHACQFAQLACASEK